MATFEKNNWQPKQKELRIKKCFCDHVPNIFIQLEKLARHSWDNSFILLSIFIFNLRSTVWFHLETCQVWTDAHSSNQRESFITRGFNGFFKECNYNFKWNWNSYTGSFWAYGIMYSRDTPATDEMIHREC